MRREAPKFLAKPILGTPIFGVRRILLTVTADFT